MGKALKGYHPSEKGGLSRDPKKAGTYSASGIYGDATMTTCEQRRNLDGFRKPTARVRRFVCVPFEHHPCS
jgi:hypothetical protein